MLRSLGLIIGLVLAIALPLHPAFAVVMTCTNCGTELTQLANNLQLAEQLAKQVELLQTALKSYEDMLTNTKGLDKQSFGDVLSDLRKVTAALDQAKSLSVTSADLDTRFAEKFKSYEAYVKAQLGSEALADKYRQWSEDTNSSVLTTLQAGRQQAGQIEGSEESLFAGLEGLAKTAEGRMQALQLANQIALAAARQTQKLRQLMLIQIQLQANAIQTEMDRRASQDAALDRFVKTGRDQVKTGDGKGY
jgi:P-type conjugative transfer protein TrbJ